MRLSFVVEDVVVDVVEDVVLVRFRLKDFYCGEGEEERAVSRQ